MLVQALLDANRRRPHTPAVDDGVRSLTYRQLTRFASVLRDVVRHSTQSERVGIMLPASSVFPAALFGVLWSSRIAVPLNFLLSPDELARIVKDAGLDLILTVHHFEHLSTKLPARTLFLEDLALKRKSVFALLRRLPPAPATDPQDTAVILYTSGTTAEPKGVELTHANVNCNCLDTIHSLDVDPRQKILNILPPFHIFGLTANVLMPVVLGATVFAIPRFRPVAVVKTVVAKKITVIMAIPSMYAALLRTKSTRPDAFSSIYLAICGGEPLSENVRAGFKERFGVTLREGYGLTETSPVVSINSSDICREGTVGKPIRNVEVRITGADGGSLPVGQDGEILVRGPGVMKGYYNKPDDTRRVIDAQGWLRTGDVGRFDQDGFLTVTGRVKELLIIGGENVFPGEIEAALEAHEAVLEAAVIGVPDETRGEAPVAFVIPTRGVQVNEQDLRHCAKRALAGFKVPKQIYVREDLPKGPTGKILKRRLRELL